MEHGKTLHNKQELVTGGGFGEALKAQASTERNVSGLGCDHEEADTRLILHTLEAISRGYRKAIVICRDTDVLLLLVHFLGQKEAEVWMVSGGALQEKLLPNS